MPLFPACTTGNTMLIGIDAHSTAIPPVPLNPHPFVGVLMLWTSPKFPMSNVMINGSPACCSGAKGYSIHIPQGTWVDIPKVTFKVWYITNLITVGFVTLFTLAANIMIGVVKGIASSLTDPQVSSSKAVWDGITGAFQPFTMWQTWAQMLIPPIPLPGAEGNTAIGSPTVSVNGGSMALGVPLGGASCSEIPIVPNATVIAFSHVQVGMTFAQLVEAFVTNAITAAAGYAGSKAAGRFIDRNRCRLGLEPIDLVSGSNFEDKTDFEIGGPLQLSWKRYYANTLGTDGPLGWNWSHQYQRWLEFHHATIVYHNEQNRSIVFPVIEKDGGSEFLPFEKLTLTRQSATQFTVSGIDGMTAQFVRLPKSDQAWIARLSNRAGEAIGFRYDPKGRLHEIVHSTGQRIKVESHTDGRITRLALACSDGKLRPLVAYEYDDHGDMVAVIDAVGRRYKYTYDDKHQMTRKTDRNGYSFHYAYDRDGRCIKSRGDDDLYAGTVEYLPPASITILHSPTGGKIIYRYDERGLITSRMDPYGGVQVFEYDKAGNKVAEVDETGSTRKYKYDDFGNVVEETNPFGGTTKRAYNDLNLKIEETDPDGNTTKWSYDHRGNLDGEMSPSGDVTLYEYDSRNRLSRKIDPSGKATNLRYDDGGRLIAIFNDPGALLTAFRYDDWGRIIERREGDRRMRYRFDDLGRLLEITFPDGSQSKRQYDAEGNLTSDTDPRGRTRRYEYSSWNKCVATRAPNGQTIRYSFNRADEMVKVVDGAGHQTEFERDHKDRPAVITLDQTPFSRRIFDADWNVKEVYDGDGAILVRREYGPGRFKIKEEPAGACTAEFVPDACGRVVKATNDGDDIKTKYDRHGKPAMIECREGSVAFHRSANGNVEKIEWSEGFSAKFAYSATGATIELIDPLGDKHEISGAGGDLRSHVFPNGWVEVKSMTPQGVLEWHRVERLENRQKRLVLRQYKCDADGNRLRETDWLRSSHNSYGYDDLDRIISAQSSESRRADFRYDAAENIVVNPGKAWEFGIGNRLNRVDDRTYTYDSRGCPKQIATSQGVREVSYDGNGRLLKVRTEQGRIVTFGYDALGRRKWKECDGKRVTFQYDEHRLLREISDDNHRRIYLYLDGANAPFMFVEQTGAVGGDGVVVPYYIHSDDIGLPRAITNRDGRCVWSWEPEPYGEGIVDESQGIEFNLRSPGQYYDRETGWRYNGFRYYDPATARFLEPDPILLKGGINIYAYPSNPWRKIDPSGLSDDCSSTTPHPSEEEPEVRPGMPVQELPSMAYRTYAEITEMLRAAGYVEVRPPGTDRSPRTGNQEEVSGIWMMRDADGTTHAVRVDPWGHAESMGPAGFPPHVHRSSFDSGATPESTPLGPGGTGMTPNEQSFLEPRSRVPGTTHYHDDGTPAGPAPQPGPGETRDSPEYTRRMDDFQRPLHTPIMSDGAPERPSTLPDHPNPERLEPLDPSGGGGSSGGSS